MARLYGTIVAQARAPGFYQIYGVPDTVNGRFDLIVLHAVLLLYRLQPEPSPVRELGQGVFDQFCRDMDANLREMGDGEALSRAELTFPDPIEVAAPDPTAAGNGDR